MGKIILSALVSLIAFGTMAQTPTEEAKLKIGLKAGLALSANRADLDSDSLSIATNGVGGRFIFGPIIDIPIKENYYFSTGLLYASKRAGLSMTHRKNSSTQDEAYSLQYLQVPATIKLYTNEVSLDTRIFFQLGGQVEANISKKSKQGNEVYINDFSPLDISILLGAGAEFRAGLNTSIFAGFSYTRGLANTVSEQPAMDDKIILKNDLFSLDIGIKF